VTIATADDPFVAQKALVDQLDKSGWDLIVGDAFVRGMRDIGYKSTSYALSELVDNSIQANATWVEVIFGFEKGRAMPAQIAVIDNGGGMFDKMVPASLIWGAGTRLDNRSGFGKYGYGLPSASVSQCLRVEVYSKTQGDPWAMSYLDVEEIARGDWTKEHRIKTPGSKLTEPPAFVVDHLKAKASWPLESGTVVVWEKLDAARIDRRRREDLRNNLLTNLGIIYRNYLARTPITVDGIKVEPCDPLFLTPGFRYYDIDKDRAEEQPAAIVEVIDKETKEPRGTMRIRFSRMPATFFRKPEAKDNNRPSRGDNNERLAVADANNGIIFLRNGRQIDVVKPPKAHTYLNATTDRFWAVEVNFDATLDDRFGMTTAKQQIVPNDQIWDLLADKAKIFEAIATMRTAYKKDAAKVAAKAKKSKPASVEAIRHASKFKTTPKPADTPARKEEAERNLKEEARRRAEKAGVSPETVEAELIAKERESSHAVEAEDLPGAPFFRCEQRGGQRVLLLNVAHPFYTDLYAGPTSDARLRAGLEILLWALGETEVDADPESDRRRFYEAERPQAWSPYLKDALVSLRQIETIDDNDEDPSVA
jgi:Histidine kinase-, DNA gyrase B-, and HSP90-like ATPase